MAATDEKLEDIKQLKNEVRRNISNLIYDHALCEELQTHVDDQCRLGFNDRDVNRYLLKLYQMYPDSAQQEVRQDIQTKLLALALGALPEDDFVSTVALNTDLQQTEYVLAVKEAFQLLRNCEFANFWDFLKEGTETQTRYFRLVNGLEDNVRNYILKSLSWVFQNITFREFHSFLGFDSVAETISLCKSKNFEIVKTGLGDLVQFPVNEANTATLNRKIIKYSVDQMNIFLQNMRS